MAVVQCMDAARSLFREVGKAVGREARYMQDVGVMWGDYLGLEPQIWNTGALKGTGNDPATQSVVACTAKRVKLNAS